MLSVTGLAKGHQLAGITWEGSQTEAGSSATTPKDAVITGAAEDYYNITYVPATLTVESAGVVVVIAGQSVTAEYDGKAHKAGYEIVSISDPNFKEEYIQFNGDAPEVSMPGARTWS